MNKWEPVGIWAGFAEGFVVGFWDGCNVGFDVGDTRAQRMMQ